MSDAYEAKAALLAAKENCDLPVIVTFTFDSTGKLLTGSNIPAALLLAPFTDDARAMILGTDVGGLGTLVASLASLISYKFYARTEGARPGRYLGFFTLLNLALLVPLIALSLLLLAVG